MQKQNIYFDCSVPLRSILIFFKYYLINKDHLTNVLMIILPQNRRMFIKEMVITQFLT